MKLKGTKFAETMVEKTETPKDMTRHECPLSNKDVSTVHQLSETLTTLMMDIAKVKAAVIGDEFNDGMKQRLSRVEQDLQTYKKLQWGVVGVGAFIGLVSGFRVILEWVGFAHVKNIILLLPFLQ